MKKKCTRCGRMLDEERFPWKTKADGTRRGDCKGCHATDRRAVRAGLSEAKRIPASSRSESKLRERDSALREHYGVSLDEWNSRFKAQNYRCAGCRGNKVYGGAWATFVKGGVVHGILCQSCNLTLKYSRGSDRVLKNLITLLRSS